MGQYYFPILLDNDGKILAWTLAHEYGNGLKLTEHSYLQNNFVQAFEFLLTPDEEYHKTRVVWAGDYADNEPESEYNECINKMMALIKSLYLSKEFV